MQNDDWGGGYASQYDPRYSRQAQDYYGQSEGEYPGGPVYPGGIAPQGYGAPHPQGYGDSYPQEFHDDWPQPAPRRGMAGGIGRVLHGSAALLSVALIAGLGVWGYQLAMRDVTGVPVVRALEGPMRIQPEDPGGVAAAHQGFAVNNIAAAGQAEAPAEQVALAPAPVVLEDDDLPVQDDTEVSAVSMAEADETIAEDITEPAPELASLTDGETDDVSGAVAMANAIASSVQPLSGEEVAPSAEPEAEVVLASAVIPASVPGVARSPRPHQRPDEIVARASTSPVDLAVASAVAATSGQSVVRDIDAGQLAAGTRLAQLGAFDSEEVARSEWEKVAMRFPEMLDGKDRVIEKAQSGGKTFYRLRAMGFEDLSDARRFCAALMAGQAACIPVVTR